MRAIAVEVTADRATVVLRPCWLARMFGAQEMVCQLLKNEHGTWFHEVSGDRVSHSHHAGIIQHALDFRPRSGLPVARLTSRSSP